MQHYQPCRACGTRFPFREDADYCPRCSAANGGDIVMMTTAGCFRVDDQRGFVVGRFSEDRYGKVTLDMRYREEK